MSSRSCACPRSTTPIIILCGCASRSRVGGPAGQVSIPYTYIRVLNIGGFLIWRSVGRSAKAPNLIPRQIFRLYGNIIIGQFLKMCQIKYTCCQFESFPGILLCMVLVLAYHDRTDHGQLIVEMPRLFDVTCLECDLEAGTAHTKPHAVHVDVIWKGAPRCTAIVVGELLNEGRGSGYVLVHCRERRTNDLRISIKSKIVLQHCSQYVLS